MSDDKNTPQTASPARILAVFTVFLALLGAYLGGMGVMNATGAPQEAAAAAVACALAIVPYVITRSVEIIGAK